MRRKCRRNQFRQLAGMLLAAAGAGMLFACLLSECAFLLGVVLIILGGMLLFGK